LRMYTSLSVNELAALLGVRAESISRWQNQRPPDRATWTTVATLALEHIEGRTATLDHLRALAKRPRTFVRFIIAPEQPGLLLASHDVGKREKPRRQAARAGRA